MFSAIRIDLPPELGELAGRVRALEEGIRRGDRWQPFAFARFEAEFKKQIEAAPGYDADTIDRGKRGLGPYKGGPRRRRKKRHAPGGRKARPLAPSKSGADLYGALTGESGGRASSPVALREVRPNVAIFGTKRWIDEFADLDNTGTKWMPARLDFFRTEGMRQRMTTQMEALLRGLLADQMDRAGLPTQWVEEMYRSGDRLVAGGA